MHVYIIRHAHAIDAEDDALRSLSSRGRKQVRALARFLQASDALQPAEIWHSPLVRARDTAVGLADAAKLDAPLKQTDGLRSGDDPHIVAARLEARRAPVAVVGHEPHLSSLVSLLVTGATEPPAIVLKKCAAVRLDRLEDRWAVRWHVSPEILE